MRKWMAVGLLASLTIAGGGAPASTSVTTPTPHQTQPPTTTAALPACSPEPCADYKGLQMRVLAVNSDFLPWTNGFHVVRVTVRYQDVSGEQQADPTTELAVRDAVGVWQQTGFWLGSAPAGCTDPQNVVEPIALAPGGTAGPYNLCFEAGGSASAPLLLAWEPSALTNGGTNEPNCTPRRTFRPSTCRPLMASCLRATCTGAAPFC